MRFFFSSLLLKVEKKGGGTFIFFDGHRSARVAVGGCCSGQEMSSENVASTHSRGTRPAVPLQSGLTLKED